MHLGPGRPPPEDTNWMQGPGPTSSREVRIRPGSGRTSLSGGEDRTVSVRTLLRILAPVFFDIYVKPQSDLKHPLTIFDETSRFEMARRPRRTQEDSGALQLGDRRLRSEHVCKGQGPTSMQQDPKQARFWQG